MGVVAEVGVVDGNDDEVLCAALTLISAATNDDPPSSCPITCTPDDTPVPGPATTVSVFIGCVDVDVDAPKNRPLDVSFPAPPVPPAAAGVVYKILSGEKETLLVLWRSDEGVGWVDAWGVWVGPSPWDVAVEEEG